MDYRAPHASAKIPAKTARANTFFAAADWGNFNPAETSVFEERNSTNGTRSIVAK
jgi:hypothetical protein